MRATCGPCPGAADSRPLRPETGVKPSDAAGVLCALNISWSLQRLHSSPASALLQSSAAEDKACQDLTNKLCWPRLKNIGLRHDGQTSRSVVKGWAFEIPEQTISAKHPRRTNQMSTRIRKAASELQYETFDLSHFGNSLECS